MLLSARELDFCADLSSFFVAQEIQRNLPCEINVAQNKDKIITTAKKISEPEIPDILVCLMSA